MINDQLQNLLAKSLESTTSSLAIEQRRARDLEEKLEAAKIRADRAEAATKKIVATANEVVRKATDAIETAMANKKADSSLVNGIFRVLICSYKDSYTDIQFTGSGVIITLGKAKDKPYGVKVTASKMEGKTYNVEPYYGDYDECLHIPEQGYTCLGKHVANSFEVIDCIANLTVSLPAWLTEEKINEITAIREKELNDASNIIGNALRASILSNFPEAGITISGISIIGPFVRDNTSAESETETETETKTKTESKTESNPESTESQSLV